MGKSLRRAAAMLVVAGALGLLAARPAANAGVCGTVTVTVCVPTPPTTLP